MWKKRAISVLTGLGRERLGQRGEENGERREEERRSTVLCKALFFQILINDIARMPEKGIGANARIQRKPKPYGHIVPFSGDKRLHILVQA